MDAMIKRINELYKKSKAEGLTEEEKHEQAKLRRDYVKGFRKDLISQLNNVTLKNPDGSLTHLRDKGIKESAQSLCLKSERAERLSFLNNMTHSSNKK